MPKSLRKTHLKKRVKSLKASETTGWVGKSVAHRESSHGELAQPGPGLGLGKESGIRKHKDFSLLS